ncbi:MAG: GNAT family N-acetyltransferase [Bacteroidetes bacterium]|nr:GNAT family N-acetyltransferase [Bacteroidota bacterium]
MEIKSLAKIEKSTIYKAFNQAFEDYDVHINELELQKMLSRRGFNSELSFAIFEKNKIIAFTLNGIGIFNGKKTAYDTGTGTLKKYRGKGLATKIFNYSIPYLKEKEVKQYLLEVLQHNEKAVSIYKKLDFTKSREFNYFIQKNINISIDITNPNLFNIKHLNNNDLKLVHNFWDFNPSWQNNFEAIYKNPKDFIFLGAFINDKLKGYIIFEPLSGDISQLAVEKHHRRKGIASLLIKEVLKINENKEIKIINAETTCDSITNFLKSKNILLTGKQFEMIKIL